MIRFGGVPVFGEGRIVFSRNDGIYIMGSNGAGVELVVAPDLGFRDPALSPNRESVAYLTLNAATMNRAGACEAHQKRCGVYYREPRTRRVLDLPAWSPDGKRLAYSECHRTFSSLRSIPSILNLIGRSPMYGNKNEMPSWPPDGEKIAVFINP